MAIDAEAKTTNEVLFEQRRWIPLVAQEHIFRSITRIGSNPHFSSTTADELRDKTRNEPNHQFICPWS